MPIQLPEEFVLPDYDSGTIANIPATAATLLDVPFEGLPPLREELWQPLAGDVKRVVVFLIDALGWNIIERERDSLAGLAEATVDGKITSVFPSTTTNALSSIWTGTAPGQHGLVNIRILLPELGTIGQMIHMTPAFATLPDSLIDAGLDPVSFLATESVGSKMTKAGVQSFAYKNRNIVGSALSNMHGRSLTDSRGASSVADMMTQVRDQLEESRDEKLYIHMYWETVDKLSHIYGNEHDVISAETHTLFWQLKHLLIDALSPEAREGTVVLLMADHGQIDVPLSDAILLEEHPELQDMLLMRLAGSGRMPILYAKQGRVQDAIDYINEHFPDKAYALRSEDALELGLYGPPPFAPRTRERLGDFIVLMRGNATWIEPIEMEKAKIVISRHSSLMADEMEVPFIGWRLG
ncbi:MAG: alkaline phosphatase family protein [Candidatus Promineifilaceae bacterium]